MAKKTVIFSFLSMVVVGCSSEGDSVIENNPTASREAQIIAADREFVGV